MCQNKSKLVPNSYPDVYTLNCICNAKYIGETKKKVITRTIEHQQDSIKGMWESSGATEHCLECLGQFNWLHPKTLSWEPRYKGRKIWVSREIIRSKCNSSKSNINRDDGNFVKTNGHLFWETLTILKVHCAIKKRLQSRYDVYQHLYINGSYI